MQKYLEFINKELLDKGYFKENINVEQGSTNNKYLKSLLEKAKKGRNYDIPDLDLIITFSNIKNCVMIVKFEDDFNDILHYAKYINGDFHIISIKVKVNYENNFDIISFVLEQHKDEPKRTDGNRLLDLYTYLSNINLTKKKGKIVSMEQFKVGMKGLGQLSNMFGR
jgi:hypothetical protein